MLDVRGLSVEFDGFRAVDDVSLTVAAGSIVGIAGTNGAGKSTLFAAIAGQLAPAHGSISFHGAPITRLAPSARARLGLARTFQVPREFGRLTVRENLLAAAPNRHETLRAAWFARAAARREEAGIAQRADEVLALTGLTGVRDQWAANLSGGQKKLLELARTLMCAPKCILLDEPFAGVNPVLIEQLLHVLRAIHARGIALVVIEHHLRALSSLVPRLIVMDQGRTIADGAPAAVLGDERVRAAYMGGVV
jgi:branched-chain amino acid transport system ATP-binding protein